MTFEGTQALPGGTALGIGTAAPGFVGTAPLASPPAWASAAVVPNPVLAPYQNTPDVEARAANEFMQAASADLIRKLYQYLETNAQQHGQLAACIPLVSRAAELFGAGDYTAAFSQAYQAYRAITIQRSSVPTLPSLE